MRRIGLTAVLLLCACQPQARRLLVLDLALSEPALLNGTVQPWSDEGYAVEYRRFYPHLARADLDRYRVLLFLLGREPEAPSDALTVGDLALLTEWVLRGGVAVLGYDADGEGYLDRWTTNRWLDFLGTGISIGDRLLEDTTTRALTTTGRPQPWAEARTVGDEPLGSPLGEVYEPFPLDRNNVITVRDHSALLAVTSLHAFVRAPRPPRAPSPRGGAGVVAAARVGDGLVLVISRHALGALGPQFRPTTAPLQQPDALERTRGFLTALARWTRRPAEWAHVPPAVRGVPVALQQAPIPVELVPPPLVPPVGVDTVALPLVPDSKLDRATSVPNGCGSRGCASSGRRSFPRATGATPCGRPPRSIRSSRCSTSAGSISWEVMPTRRAQTRCTRAGRSGTPCGGPGRPRWAGSSRPASPGFPCSTTRTHAAIPPTRHAGHGARASPCRAPSIRRCGPRDSPAPTPRSAGWPQSSVRWSSGSGWTSTVRTATRWARSSATPRGGAASPRWGIGRGWTRCRPEPATRPCGTPDCCRATIAPSRPK